MTDTALSLITGSAKLIGVVFKSEALSADEANDGLTALNDLLGTWSNDGLSTFADTLESFTLTGASSYTIGSGGTFDTTRPISIVSAVVRVSSIDYPLKIVSQAQYEKEVALKSQTSSYPEYLVYNYANPLGILTMYPLDTAGSTLRLLSKKPLTALASLTTEITFPPGWKRALKFNLAIDLAPEYGVEVPAWVEKTAKTSLGAIKRAAAANKPMPLLPSDIPTGNIYTGYYS